MEKHLMIDVGLFASHALGEMLMKHRPGVSLQDWFDEFVGAGKGVMLALVKTAEASKLLDSTRGPVPEAWHNVRCGKKEFHLNQLRRAQFALEVACHSLVLEGGEYRPDPAAERKVRKANGGEATDFADARDCIIDALVGLHEYRTGARNGLNAVIATLYTAQYRTRSMVFSTEDHIIRAVVYNSNNKGEKAPGIKEN